MDKQLFSNVRYLTINEKDEQWGLYINTVGFQSIAARSAYPPKGHPLQYWFDPAIGRTLHEYQLVYVTKGSGVFKTGSAPAMRIEEGNILLLFPGEWHSYRPLPESGWDTYWIGFNGSYPNHLIRQAFFNKKAPLLDIGFNERMVQLFNQAIELAKAEKTGFQQAVSGIVLQLLGSLYYIRQNNLFDDKAIVQRIEKARMIMREHPQGDVSLQAIAAELNMSYSWFRKMFKQYTGLSPAQYQLQVKLQKAKALLISSSKSVKEIAYLLDFESPNYFTTFFKAKTGYTPLAFRNISHGRK